MIFTAGIDVGSTCTKAVVITSDDKVAGTARVDTGFRLAEAAADAYQQALKEAGLSEQNIAYIVSTGLGRYQVPFRDSQITDLTAHARGARSLFPRTRTVLDVGGQTMKAMLLDEGGKVKSFRLNDKCAAGTGAFLVKTARYMGYGVGEIGALAASSKEPVSLSSVCAVFAESEVINLLTLGKAAPDILCGAIVALAGRAVQLMKRAGMKPEFTLTGGLNLFGTMVDEMRATLKSEVNVPPDGFAQYVGAFGAALLARRRLEKLVVHEARSDRPPGQAFQRGKGARQQA